MKALRDFYVQRKITCPVLPANHLYREALVSQVRHVFVGTEIGEKQEERGFLYKLVLLHAPAGYGKTSFLVDVTRQIDLPFCWYQLDHTDTDRTTFLMVLFASI